nr:immunoglobulin heavy chain junction region [Mus musculus]
CARGDYGVGAYW